MSQFLVQLWGFMRTHKKLWLLPLLLLIALLGAIVVLLNGSVAMPFIYTIF